MYYNVYNRISDALKYSMLVDLQEASPKLFSQHGSLEPACA